ncbi:metal-dependent transcriptional regulator [Furfurilactobacillus siliginis]|uniref:Manganese transport regulator n=2 Tax=Furfurilactobacillus siliginis TaxID=348151 RepID=A0A510VRS1_9LACO|nr:metal-dependent transcriptional regulator [Furfurilactobacillus siliginis]GEK29663.1 Cro/Cl family transcriptional regulator [Furfurilactobacillus siliginis]
MTPMKEDYLKMIFELGGVSGKVSNKQLSLSLDIAAASVTEMINKLVEERLVSHTPYAGISLTKSGRKAAEELVRKHRLWECFLFDKLDYTLATVHQEAEQLEHSSSDQMIDKLDAYLGHPEHCPHGGAIPDPAGNYEVGSRTTLAQVNDGAKIRLSRFVDNHDLLEYLESLNFVVGQEFTVNSHAPFEGPISLTAAEAGNDIDVSFKAANNIFIDEL